MTRPELYTLQRDIERVSDLRLIEGRVCVSGGEKWLRADNNPVLWGPVLLADHWNEGDTALAGMSQDGALWALAPAPVGDGGGGDTTALSSTWTWTTATSAPASGRIGINTAAWTTATQLNVSETNTANADTSNFLGLIEPGDSLYVQDQADSGKWARYRASARPSDQGAWRSIALTYVDSGPGGLPANNRSTVLLVAFGGGSSGGAPAFQYVHTQSVAVALWDVVHNLNGWPSVTLVDNSNRTFLADVNYIDANRVQVILSAALAGKAYLS